MKIKVYIKNNHFQLVIYNRFLQLSKYIKKMIKKKTKNPKWFKKKQKNQLYLNKLNKSQKNQKLK